MPRTTMTVLVAMLMVLVAVSAFAQCNVGVYGDSIGELNYLNSLRSGYVFHVYVVLFDESAINAVSYSLVVPGIGADIFIIDDPLSGIETLYGPTGNGININVGNGNNVGLGECAPGFLNQPILVADYSLIFASDFVVSRLISVVANPGDATPIVSDCIGQLRPCAVGPSLIFQGNLASESTSFGAVKSLYLN